MKPAIELGALQSRVNHLATGLAVGIREARRFVAFDFAFDFHGAAGTAGAGTVRRRYLDPDLFGKVENRHLHIAAENFDIPQRIYFSNEENETSTMLEIQAQDRIGLLYDIFTILGNHDAEVLNARISTQAGAAIDRFFLVDSSTELKITDKNRLTRMQDELQKCILVTRIESDLR